MKITKSVVINTRNEQEMLQGCVDSIKNWADEIILVDMESTDDTIKIAKDNNLTIFNHPNVGYVEPARNFAISKASGNWIFIIDADERANRQLLFEFDRIIQNQLADYVWVPRNNIIFGQAIKYARWWPDYNIRFFKRNQVIWNDEIHSIPQKKGKEYFIEPNENLSIEHHNYQNISQFISRVNRYTDQQVINLINQRYKFTWPDLITKPTSEFLSRYFAGQGYKDGLHGLAICLLQSVSELVLYLKLWQSTKFKPDNLSQSSVSSIINKQIKDYYYWQSQTQTNSTQRIMHKLKSKFF